MWSEYSCAAVIPFFIRDEPAVPVEGDISGRGEVPSTGGGGIALESGGADVTLVLGIKGVAIGGGAVVAEGNGGIDPVTGADGLGNGVTGLTPAPNGDVIVERPPDEVGVGEVVVATAFC